MLLPRVVLLVHDDADAIALLERLLKRAGREVVVETTVAGAIARLQDTLPSLLILAPAVESARGHVVLEELVTKPNGRATPVLLLGEGSPGFDHPIAALPPNESFIAQVQALSPPASLALLAEAEAALQRSRDEAAEKARVAALTAQQLDAEARTASQHLETERAAHQQTRDEKQDTELKLQALQREHEQTQTALASLSREHDEAMTRREALKTKLDASLKRLQERSDAAQGLETRVEELEAQLSALQTELATEREARTTVEVQRSELAAVDARLEEDVTRLREALETARASHATELANTTSTRDAALEALRLSHAAERADAAGARDALNLAHATELANAAGALDTLKHSHAAELAQATGALDALRASHDADLTARRAQLTAMQQELDAANASHRAEVTLLHQQLDAAELHARTQQAEQTAYLGELEQLLAGVRAHVSDLEARLAEQTDTLEHERSAASAALAASRDALTAVKAEQKRAEAERDAALERSAALQRELSAQNDLIAAARARLNASGAVPAARAETYELPEHVAAVTQQLTLARADLATANVELEAMKTLRAADHTRAEAAEKATTEARERIHTLESRTHLVTTLDDSPAPLAIARTGSVALGELARLMVQLATARADTRVDLTVAEGTRRLWLRRGALVAAWSSLKAESLGERARRDGLIDAAQAAELKALRDATPASVLEELRQRGWVRRNEIAALVQRQTEELALEAFTEAVCTYRLYDEPPGAEVPLAEGVRPLPALVALGLRRGLPWEAQLSLLGGSEAVPARVASPLDPELLGFNERERNLLDSLDAETGLETLIAQARLTSERGYQALAVAKLLGLISVNGAGDAAGGTSELQSLDAKYEQVQQTDYFTMLGVARSASAADIQAARERLRKQFDPLKYSAHEDPGVLRRAQVVYGLIEEAGRTLADDRLRLEYARHLLE